jgi:peptide/nickel transport system permease protein
VRASRLVAVAAGWLVLVVLAALFAGALPIDSPLAQDLEQMLAPPGLQHWFGADSLGRDVFARTLHGLRVTFAVSLGAVTLALLAGTALGLCAGYFRGRPERAILLGVNVLLAFPPLVLVIAATAWPGDALPKVIAALAIVFVPAVTRLARVATLRVGGQAFVLAARAAGMRPLRLICTELLPNVLPPLLAYGLLMVSLAALAEAALGFLGLGVPPPVPTLGSMMAAEQARVLEAPHAVFFPGGVLLLTTLALNLVGEELQRRLDDRAGNAG